MSSISIDNYINIINNVLSTVNGQGSLSGNFLTNKIGQIPNGTAKIYYNATDVGNDFTLGSNEYLAAQLYFNSYVNSRKTPDFMVISGFSANSPISAYLISGQISAGDVAALRALGATGTFTLKIDGVTVTATPDFTTITNVSSVAAALQAVLITASAIPTLTVTPNPNNTITIAPNQPGATHTIDYSTDTSTTPHLKTDLIGGAILSQGSDAGTTAQILDNIKAQTRNWVGLTTLYTMIQAQYLEVAAWVNTNSKYFAFVPYVDDVTNAIALQTAILAVHYENTTVVKGTYLHATGILSLGASTDYNAVNGRLNYAYKSFSGLTPSIDNDTDFTLLNTARVTFYGKNTARNDQVIYNFFFPCYTTGKFITLANVYNQIWLNDGIQTTLIQLLTDINNLPNNPDGSTIVSSALKDIINTARTNGVIQTGNTFSNTVTLTLIQEAGVDITSVLTNNGYYLQIIPATAAQRASQTFGDINFWYTNGQGVLRINIVNTLVV